ncbi:unnamed protein product [Anisakis simplex]|uniref:AAA_12 domain-containing protein n=1 Tax=Anisakis simplex TaxID=6269 RepID=A0A158PNH3_ANISI|nr:unnamed protein product [Anisakis simplex]
MVSADDRKQNDIIVLVTSRSYDIRAVDESNVKFLADPQRITVALSRASHGLLIIADFPMLLKYGTWQAYLRHATQETPIVNSNYTTAIFDENLKCWNATIKYFTDVFTSAMNGYVSTQVNIVNWYAQHGLQPVPKNIIIQDSLRRMQTYEPPDIVDQQGIINDHLTSTLVETLIDAAEELAIERPKPSTQYCPYGCEKSWNLWMWLTIASFGFSGVTIVTLLCLSRRMDILDRGSDEIEAIEDSKERQCCSLLDMFSMST